MTWLILQVLGLLSTWLLYPNYTQPLPIVDAILQQQAIDQEIAQQEAEINHREEQKQIAIDDYFIFADKIGKIVYARWCAWGYEKAVKTADGTYHNCSKKSFDCWGAMKAYLVAKWLLTKESISLFNSQVLYELWYPKDPRTAERWDFMYRRWYWQAASWNNSTHFAVVARDYNPSDSTMWIYDNVVPGGTDQFHEREIPITCNSTMCHYAGMFRIYVSTNGVYEFMTKYGKEITPRVDTMKQEVDSGTQEVLMSTIPEAIASGTATRYDYDLKWEHRSESHDTCALRIKERYGYYKVVNVDNGKSVTCFHNDYGPKEYTNKVIDLSSHAFEQIADKRDWIIKNVLIYKL